MTAIIYLAIGIIALLGIFAFIGVLIYMLHYDSDALNTKKTHTDILREKGLI